MSFFGKLFGGKVTCPACGSKYARDSLSGIKCPTPDCVHNPASTAGRERLAGSAPAPAPASAHASQASPSGFTLSNPIEVEYENHRGEQKTFTGNRDTLQIRGRHVSLCVAPTGRRIALALDRIRNRAVVEQAGGARLQAMQGGATRRDLYIVDFHRRRGTDSPRCQAIRNRFPGL